MTLREDGALLGRLFSGAPPSDDRELRQRFAKLLGRPLEPGETVNRVTDPKSGQPAYVLHSDGAEWRTLKTAAQLRGDDDTAVAPAARETEDHPQ